VSYFALRDRASPVPLAFTAKLHAGVKGWVHDSPISSDSLSDGLNFAISFPAKERHRKLSISRRNSKYLKLPTTPLPPPSLRIPLEKRGFLQTAVL